MVCKSGLSPKKDPLGDMMRPEGDRKGSVFWRASGGDAIGATSASLDVLSNARGGDLARCAAGIASASGGEKVEEEDSNAMLVPVEVRTAHSIRRMRKYARNVRRKQQQWRSNGLQRSGIRELEGRSRQSR